MGVKIAGNIKEDPDRLFTEQEAAEFLGLAKTTLNKWRHFGTGPKYIKLGKRAVRYRRRDLLEWLGTQPVISNTSESKVGAG